MKAFLTRNKIYFETIAAVSLTMMALMVSVKSCQITNRQLEIERREAEIREKEISPQLKNDLTLVHPFPGRDSRTGSPHAIPRPHL